MLLPLPPPLSFCPPSAPCSARILSSWTVPFEGSLKEGSSSPTLLPPPIPSPKKCLFFVPCRRRWVDWPLCQACSVSQHSATSFSLGPSPSFTKPWGTQVRPQPHPELGEQGGGRGSRCGESGWGNCWRCSGRAIVECAKEERVGGVWMGTCSEGQGVPATVAPSAQQPTPAPTTSCLPSTRSFTLVVGPRPRCPASWAPRLPATRFAGAKWSPGSSGKR